MLIIDYCLYVSKYVSYVYYAYSICPVILLNKKCIAYEPATYSCLQSPCHLLTI